MKMLIFVQNAATVSLCVNVLKIPEVQKKKEKKEEYRSHERDSYMQGAFEYNMNPGSSWCFLQSTRFRNRYRRPPLFLNDERFC